MTEPHPSLWPPRRMAAVVSQPEQPSGLGTIANQDIERALRSVRQHLGMDVAFVAEFAGDRRYFRQVDTAGPSDIFRVGASMPQSEGYCLAVVEGRLPELIPDADALPAAQAIAATRALPIGSHLSVPLRLSDGQLYGTFCCLRHQADPTLNERDLDTLKAVADIVAGQIEKHLAETAAAAASRTRIEAMLAEGGPSMVYQPIFGMGDGRIDGVEALARFGDLSRSPDLWFAEAQDAGRGVELERLAIAKAVDGMRPVWDRCPLHLGLNCSPQAILAGDLASLWQGIPPRHIVLEITEHDTVDDYGALSRALQPLRGDGVKIAIDDAGSGYASMRHILNVEPDIIKLDVSLTKGIGDDRMRRALAHALIEFGHQTGCRICAEGVETAEELETLRTLGVHAVQGYHLGRPMPIDGIEALCTSH